MFVATKSACRSACIIATARTALGSLLRILAATQSAFEVASARSALGSLLFVVASGEAIDCTAKLIHDGPDVDQSEIDVCSRV